MSVEDQLKATLERVAAGHAVPADAYDRFARRRARRAVVATLGAGLALGLLLAVVVVVLRPPAGQGPAAPPAAPNPALVQTAIEARDRLGDPNVSSVAIYATTVGAYRHASAQAPPPGPDQDVYVLVLRGHFTCAGCSRPPGAAPPTGRVAAIVLDRRTLDQVEFGLSDRLDVGPLGPADTIPLP
jgi:hypothetical protein